jgi:hypothetical protein
MAPTVFPYTWHAGHGTIYTQASHTQRAISIAKSCKTELGVLTFKLKTPKPPSSRANFPNLISAKSQRCWILCVTFFVDVNQYKICLNPSSYAKVITVSPKNMLLQITWIGSRSNRLPCASKCLAYEPRFEFDQSHWSLPAATGLTCIT